MPGRSPPLWSRFLNKVKTFRASTEDNLLKMPHLYAMLNQITFFTMCDRAMGSGQRVNTVYSLMMYNVIAYCFNYIRDLIKKEDWSLSVPVSAHSGVRHLAMTATGLVLEWTKAVTFLITVVFLVLSFSAKEGLDHYQPSVLYTISTGLHYMATEKTFYEMFPQVLKWLKVCSSLELLWSPVILKIYTMVTSAAMACCQLFMRNYRLAIFGLYFNVALCWRDAEKTCFQELNRELSITKPFREATASQLAAYDDVCSVCLSTMTSSLVTSCGHMFHEVCLRECLHNSQSCPLCKSPLVSAN